MMSRRRLQWPQMTIILLFIMPVQNCVRFITEPRDIITTAGKTVRLDCKANFDSFGRIPQYRWTLNEQYLDFIGDTRRSLLENGSLLIKNVFNNDKKYISKGLESYKCVAFVDDIGAVVSRTASVILPRLSFEKQPTDLRLFSGQTAHFSCLFNSQPLQKLIWLKDHLPLVIDNRMTIFPSGALEIDDVRKEDNGLYRCNVTVLDIHTLSKPGVLTIVENKDTIKILKAPTFVAKPNASITLEGSIVTLHCTAVGNPRPQISWWKGGTLIQEDTQFKIVGTGSLQISHVNKNNDGYYICLAKNSEGSIEATAKIDVHVKPLFIHKPEDTIGFEKENITLECEVTGKPPPRVIWLKNGDRVKPDEYIQIVNGTNLKIFGLLTMDSGIFQCLASNSAGNIQSSAFLNVLHRDENSEDLKKKQHTSPKTVSFVSTSLATSPWINPIKLNDKIYTVGNIPSAAIGLTFDQNIVPNVSTNIKDNIVTAFLNNTTILCLQMACSLSLVICLLLYRRNIKKDMKELTNMKANEVSQSPSQYVWIHHNQRELTNGTQSLNSFSVPATILEDKSVINNN